MKLIQGIVTSAKNTNTVTVTVTRKWQHPLYKKYVKRTKNYACHVENLELKEGDTVSIKSCRPISKTKSFIVTAKIDPKGGESVLPTVKVVKNEAEVKVAVEATKSEKKATPKAKAAKQSVADGRRTAVKKAK